MLQTQAILFVCAGFYLPNQSTYLDNHSSLQIIAC